MNQGPKCNINISSKSSNVLNQASYFFQFFDPQASAVPLCPDLVLSVLDPGRTSSP